MRAMRILIVVGLLVLAAGVIPADEPGNRQPRGRISELAGMSLEDLAEVEISSVSRRKERLSGAAAAVYVITEEEIHRSAANNLTDLLRTAPGIHVARLDASTRSVSSRGFSSRYTNNLLVLVDGRSIYSPLFSGVEWEFADRMLADIERIEIIRGPGGALWGANAVNGVINIVTKKAADTQGGLLHLGTGTEYPGFGAVRYGGKAGKHGHYRLHLRYFNADEAASAGRFDANDKWQSGRGGVRADWDWGDTGFTLIADVFRTEINQTFAAPSRQSALTEIIQDDSDQSGGSLLGRWTHTFANEGELRVQAYYDRTQGRGLALNEKRDNFDLELQYQFPTAGRHEFMVGAGFRYYEERTEGSPLSRLHPETQRKRLFSAFVQDQIAFLDGELMLTLGTKLEHNDFTGFEIQPNARLAWTPNDRHTLWAAVSRAVRTPSLFEASGSVTSLASRHFLITLEGREAFDAEELLALEAGYRLRARENLYFDLALFYNDYDNLRSLEIGLPQIALMPPPRHIALPFGARNNLAGNTYGAELAVDWQPTPWWRLHLNYSLLQMDLTLDARTIDIVSGGIDESSPEQQVFLGSYMDLGDAVELDVFLRYVDQLPAVGIDDYLTADIRLAWHPRDDFEIAIVGHDLLQPDHSEFDSMFVDTIPTKTERGVYGTVTWRF